MKHEEEFKTALHALVEDNRQILAVALLDADGACLADLGTPNMDRAEIAGYLAALLQPGPGALSQLRINRQGFMLSNLPGGHVLVRQVEQMAVLCILSRAGGKLPLPLPDTTALAAWLEQRQSPPRRAGPASSPSARGRAGPSVRAAIHAPHPARFRISPAHRGARARLCPRAPRGAAPAPPCSSTRCLRPLAAPRARVARLRGRKSRARNLPRRFCAHGR